MSTVLRALIIVALMLLPSHDVLAQRVVDLSKSWEEDPLYNRNQAYCNIQSAMASGFIEGWVVVKNGLIAAEGYGDEDRKERDHLYPAFSVTKSWSTMLIGKMVELGQVSIHETLGEIFTQDSDWAGVGQVTEKQAVTLEELLTMTSGLVSGPKEVSGQTTMQDVLNYATFKEDQRGKFFYLGANQILSRIIFRRSGLTPLDFAYSYNIFQKLGIQRNKDIEWDKFGGVEGSAYGLSLTPRVLAKLGQLYLQHGLAAEGDQLILPEWVEASVTDQLNPDTESVQCLFPGYGYQWYVDRKEREGLFVPIPEMEGAFAANGAKGQQLIVIPKSNTVIALMSNDCTFVYNTMFLVIILKNLSQLNKEAHSDQCGTFSLASFSIRSSIGLALGLLKVLSNLIFE